MLMYWAMEPLQQTSPTITVHLLIRLYRQQEAYVDVLN